MSGCVHEYSHVIDSRPSGPYRRRRHACPECRERWTTIEVRVSDRFQNANIALILDLSSARLEAIAAIVRAFPSNLVGTKNA